MTYDAYEYTFSKKDLSVASKFPIDQFNKDSFYDYLAYQFAYWSEKKTRMQNGFYPVHWILGKKSVERWNDKPEHWKIIIATWKFQFGSGKHDLFDQEYYKPSNLDTVYEGYKQSCANEASIRLAYCSSMLISYSVLSSTCRSCKAMLTCKNRTPTS